MRLVKIFEFEEVELYTIQYIKLRYVKDLIKQTVVFLEYKLNKIECKRQKMEFY